MEKKWLRRMTAWCLSLLLVLGLMACSRGPSWQEQYDLGMQYLTQSSYEEAILAFTAAIEIDEKRPEAYFGRGQSYYGVVTLIKDEGSVDFLTDAELPEDQLSYFYQQAILDYEKAIELDPQTAEYYDAMMKTALEYGDIDRVIRYGEQKYQYTEDTGLKDIFEAVKTSSELLDQLAEAFAGGSDQEIFDLMQGEKYAALISLQEYLDRPIVRTYGKHALGVYRVENPLYGYCMIYYGDYLDGMRSGTGAWYGYDNGNNYASHGDWADDMPNGRFETKEWNSNLNESVFYRLVSGNVTDGLWDGSVLWAFDHTDGVYRSWTCTFHNGLVERVRVDTSDGETKYVWSDQSNEGEKVSLDDKEGQENQLKGIPGFAPVYE